MSNFLARCALMAAAALPATTSVPQCWCGPRWSRNTCRLCLSYYIWHRPSRLFICALLHGPVKSRQFKWHLSMSLSLAIVTFLGGKNLALGLCILCKTSTALWYSVAPQDIDIGIKFQASLCKMRLRGVSDKSIHWWSKDYRFDSRSGKWKKKIEIPSSSYCWVCACGSGPKDEEWRER